MEVRLYFYLAIGFNSISGLSFTEKFRVVFCRTLLPMTDVNHVNCQRSAYSSALVLSNPYKGFGSTANSGNLMVTPFIFRNKTVVQVDGFRVPETVETSVIF